MANRILVPVSPSPTARQTVGYAVRTALEDGPGYVRFVYVLPFELGTDEEELEIEGTAEGIPSVESGEDMLHRVRVWAEEDAGSHTDELTIETDLLGLDEYLFSPVDVANAIADEALLHDVDRIVLDPEYDPGIGAPFVRPLEYELTRFEGFDVDEAPVTRQVRRTPLVERTSALQIGTLFGISFLFYQILGGTFDAFDLVTGTIAALIVAVGLSRVTFHEDPSSATLVRILRMAIYTPYLLFEIIKANVVVAYVILHPRLPIDPRMTRIRPAVWGGLPITTLANSITLTPGTLTVRVEGRTLKVHTLIPSAREDLFDGRLERAVRFVFYGRDGMNLRPLGEREKAEILPVPDHGAREDRGESDDRGDRDEQEGAGDSS